MIDGDLMLSNGMMQSDKIIIVTGNVTFSTGSTINGAGLLYVGGDLKGLGAVEFHGVLAVEGKANLENSLLLRPTINPNDILDSFVNSDAAPESPETALGEPTWGSGSWNRPSIAFSKSIYE